MQVDKGIFDLMNMYRYSVGLGVPLTTLGMGIVGKKTARGPGWLIADFYVGTELTLAGVSGALVNIFDLLRPERFVGMLARKLMAANIGIAIIGLLLFYVVLSLHQDYGPNANNSTRKQHIWLLLISNVVGLGTLIGALLLMAP
jgi:hypothetical protein